MENKKVTIAYIEYKDLKELNDSIRNLINKTDENLQNSYSPYSKFKVSALVEFQDGSTELGTNQENAAYPSGLCAERVALFSGKSKNPEKEIKRIFISTEQGGEFPFSPCGGCRQVMMEYELNQKHTIEVWLKSGNSKIWQFSSVRDLLPFAFEADEILKK